MSRVQHKRFPAGRPKRIPRALALAALLAALVPLAVWLNADRLWAWHYSRLPVDRLVREATEHRDPLAIRIAGERLLAEGSPARAADLLVPAAEQNSGDLGLQVLAGRAVWKAGDPVRGGLILRAALQREPGDPDANFWMAELLYSRGHTVHAETMLKDVARVEPSRAAAWCRLGEIALQDEHYAEALELADRTDRGKGLEGSARPFLLRAAVLRALGRVPEAEAAARKAVTTEANAETLTMLGEIVQLSPGPDRLREAQGLFIRAAEASQSPGDILKLLAVNHRTLDELPEAVKVLRSLLRVEPARAEAYLLLGQTYRSLGKKELSRRCLEIYRRLEPQEAAIARALYRVNNAKGSVDSQLALARVYLQTGRTDLARETVERALVKAPDDERARKLLAEAQGEPTFHVEPLPPDLEGDAP
jgi:tetratricopeptide (TPR) repeat protein